MGDKVAERPVLIAHGGKRLPSVEIDSYILELRDEDGFVGDKASRGAFHAILDKWREPLRKLGADPLGEKPAEHSRRRSSTSSSSMGIRKRAASSTARSRISRRP